MTLFDYIKQKKDSDEVVFNYRIGTIYKDNYESITYKEFHNLKDENDIYNLCLSTSGSIKKEGNRI